MPPIPCRPTACPRTVTATRDELSPSSLDLSAASASARGKKCGGSSGTKCNLASDAGKGETAGVLRQISQDAPMQGGNEPPAGNYDYASNTLA
jgi:hypothetical protein